MRTLIVGWFERIIDILIEESISESGKRRSMYYEVKNEELFELFMSKWW